MSFDGRQFDSFHTPIFPCVSFVKEKKVYFLLSLTKFCLIMYNLKIILKIFIIYFLLIKLTISAICIFFKKKIT